MKCVKKWNAEKEPANHLIIPLSFMNANVILGGSKLALTMMIISNFFLA